MLVSKRVKAAMSCEEDVPYCVLLRIVKTAVAENLFSSFLISDVLSTHSSCLNCWILDISENQASILNSRTKLLTVPSSCLRKALSLSTCMAVTAFPIMHSF